MNVGGARRRAALNERVAALEATAPSAFRVREGDASLESSLESSLEGLLSGVWRLAYTDAFETLAALRIANAMPGVTAGQLTQTVEIANAKSRGVERAASNADPSPPRRRANETAAPSRLVAVTTMDVSAPLLETRSFVKAELVSVPGLSQRCLSARVLEAGVEDARVVDTVSQYVSFPSSVTVLGVDVDTGVVAEASDPARNAAKAAVTVLGDAVQTLNPKLAVPVPESFPGARAWTLTTYVDADIRVARTEGGSVYLFEKIRGESR